MVTALCQGIPCGFVSTLHITTHGLSPVYTVHMYITKPQGAPRQFSSDNIPAKHCIKTAVITSCIAFYLALSKKGKVA